MDEPLRVGRFDQVKLLTTRNVSYLSAPPITEVKPGGIWSVAAVVDVDKLLLVKNNVTIRIPAADVLKIADYSLEKITKRLGRLSRGEGNKEGNKETGTKTEKYE